MANKKISDLTAGSALTGAELIEIEQSGSSAKAALNGILKTYLDTLYAPAQTVLWVRDEKSSGTAPQALSATTWNKRDLGTTKVNTISGASISSSVITLPAGTYECSAFAGAINNITDSATHIIRLYDTTSTALLVQGSSAYVGATSVPCTNSIISEGQFTLSGTKNIELQHWTSAANAGGKAASSGSTEVYAEVYIRKIS